MTLLDEVRRVRELCEKATPGPWRSEPKRLVLRGIEGPIMSYLAGDPSQPEGLKVSLGSERIADHEATAALRNLFHSHGAQIEAALEDAERYRWLRSVDVFKGHPLPERFWELLGDTLDEEFDAAIDSARTK